MTCYGNAFWNSVTSQSWTRVQSSVSIKPQCVKRGIFSLTSEIRFCWVGSEKSTLFLGLCPLFVILWSLCYYESLAATLLVKLELSFCSSSITSHHLSYWARACAYDSIQDSNFISGSGLLHTERWRLESATWTRVTNFVTWDLTLKI